MTEVTKSAKHRYILTTTGTCPVDGTVDAYEVEIVTEGDVVSVERLLDALEESKRKPLFQEELASLIANTVAGFTFERPFVVRTFGVHSDVRVETEHRWAVA